MKAFVAILVSAILAVVLLAVTTPDPDVEQHESEGSLEESVPLDAQPASTVPSRLSRDATSNAEAAQPPARLAPDFELELGNGESIRLSDYHGHAVVLDFWASWCGPCIGALPQINALSEWANENDPRIKVFAIHTMEKNPKNATIAQVANRWKQSKFSMLVPFDFGSVVARQYGVNRIPRTFVVGPDGYIIADHLGVVPGENLTEKLKQECLAALGEKN